MSKWLILIGLAIVAAGVFWPWLQKIPLGRLPGDIVIRRERWTLFFPLTTMLLVSIVLTLLVNLFLRK